MYTTERQYMHVHVKNYTRPSSSLKAHSLIDSCSLTYSTRYNLQHNMNKWSCGWAQCKHQCGKILAATSNPVMKDDYKLKHNLLDSIPTCLSEIGRGVGGEGGGAREGRRKGGMKRRWRW